MPQPGNEYAAVVEALEAEYEITDELGRGGMAIVYRARERALDRDVAIKILPFTFAFDKDFVERFQREARTAARLEHPHIIPIHRVGRSGNVIYFTMKFLRGKALARLIIERGRLSAGEIRRLLRECGSALGYAHQHGVVHRDIKPDNIMFHESGHAVVCDFGIAKAASESRLTGTGTAIGTPHYMSPEQARAKPVDGRSDLYSLGVVAYKCLTGRVPFDGEDSFAIGMQHVTADIPRPDLTDPEDEALFGIIARLMAKDPADRFVTAEEMIEAVEALGTASEVPAVSSHPSLVPASAPATGGSGVDTTAPTVVATEATTPTTPMPRTGVAVGEPPVAPRRRRRIPVLVGGAVLVVGGVGGYVLLSNRGPAAPVTLAVAPESVVSLPESLAVPAESLAALALSSATDPVAGTDSAGSSAEPADGALSTRVEQRTPASGSGAGTPPAESSGGRSGTDVAGRNAARPRTNRVVPAVPGDSQPAPVRDSLPVTRVAPPVTSSAPSSGEKPAPVRTAPPSDSIVSPPGPGPAPAQDSVRTRPTDVAAGSRDSVVSRPPSGRPVLSPPSGRDPRRVKGAGTAIRDSLRRRAVAAGIGRLELRGLIPGSSLYLDGDLSTGLRHNLPAGSHTLRLQRKGYEPYEQEFVITAGEVTRIRVHQRRRR